MMQAIFMGCLTKHCHPAVETGTDPVSVVNRVSTTLVPAIQILQSRTNKKPGGREAALLEEVTVVVIGRICIIFVVFRCGGAGVP